ncbi:preprotein translocase subunit SecA [Candidatus Uhrbacteria bacterium]|nr:preprotein translocase subunit SecA [Candidatus Uhrbacteria bacterium]
MILKLLFGDPNARVVRSLRPLLDRVNALESEFQALDDATLAHQTVAFRERLAGGATIEQILPEAFAAVRESARRVLGQRHYDVQLVGSMVLHRGQIAEMRTGEGKTLTATAAVYLNALAGKGVHVVTVNDYLARRDAAWMGKVYAALGMRVGCLNHETAYVYDPGHVATAEPPPADEAEVTADTTGAYKVVHEFLRPVHRRDAYLADITYGTNNEFGFDYLRDNMVSRAEDMVQRGHYYAIVDEVDSILIDEARTPLIISASAEGATDQYRQFAALVRKLEPTKDYVVDEKLRAVTLTEEGITHMESLLGVQNLYAEGVRIVHQLEQALRAHALYQHDREYVVRDGEVIIVDEFTGRLMHGRRYSEGLHQAIEAKEGVAIQRESLTLATITFQNYFRLYEKLAGMTGTAATEAEEFAKIYRLDVVTIPTHRPMVRRDLADRIYRTEAAKWRAVVAEVKERHAQGQPILLGTISIEKNEQLHALLEREGVPHAMLNAKNHEREGEIIAQAGRRGAVTLATNMAGRGVDIILGGNPPEASEQEAVRASGGLHVIGTERHESRRIDNQLRGRAGRQGDAGSSQFFIALSDDLMRIFAGERLQRMMERLGVPDEVPIENRIVTKQIEGAQRKVEHHHFDTRKHLLEYDDVLNKHREVIYRKRRDVLTALDPVAVVTDMLEQVSERIVAAHTPGERMDLWELDALQRAAGAMIPLDEAAIAALQIPLEHGDGKLGAAEVRTALVRTLTDATQRSIDQLRLRVANDEAFRGLIRAVVLRAMDELWIEHLDAIEHLRHGIGLRGYGQRDPLVEYKREAYRLFTSLLALIQEDVVRAIAHAAPTMAQVQSVFADMPMQFSAPAKEMTKREGESIGVAAPAAVTTSDASDTASGPHVGRNDPCPCGSGKKYKKCHGA